MCACASAQVLVPGVVGSRLGSGVCGEVGSGAGRVGAMGEGVCGALGCELKLGHVN